MFLLDSPITIIPRYGALYAKRCHALGITTIRDLLLYTPYRYEDLSRVTPIRDVRSGMTTTVRGRLLAIENRRTWRKGMAVTEAVIQDDTDAIKVIWFNQSFLTKALTAGDSVWLAGSVTDEGYGLTLKNPVYEKVEAKESLHTARIVPIYSTREKLSQKQLRLLMQAALPSARQLDDVVPERIRATHRLMAFADTIGALHFPASFGQLQLARRRMAFEELFALQVRAAKARLDRGTMRAPAIPFSEKDTRLFVVALPFQLTTDQRKAAWEVLQDMMPHEGVHPPMVRLLEGDVGSGKTMVAAIAMLNVAQAGMVTFLMAPTTILAEQHYATLMGLFRLEKWKIGLVTSSKRCLAGEGVSSDVKKADVKRALADGSLSVVVGTHALITDNALPKDRLALVVVDEQHRFGVAQRQALGVARPDGLVPHILSMTATPIPRTLALTIFSDLDLSIVKMMPKGRKPIVTRVVRQHERGAAVTAIERAIADGRQAFVICPLIDPSDTLGVRSATEEYERLRREVFPKFHLGLLHGRMKAADRENAMRLFRDGEIQILVATSVIEVGVDVPNATVMVIEGAERFGLAQLHQFRGRVGRSDHQSYCYLMSGNDEAESMKRLEAVAQSHDGFQLAERDLRFRGPGHLYGVEQSGYMDLRFARLNDVELIKETREAARVLLEKDPTLKSHTLLREKITETSPAHPE